jgi:hypothetical protein
MGDRRCVYRVLMGRTDGDLGVDWRIILKWLFNKWDGWHGLDYIDSGLGQLVGTCKCSNEPSVSMKCVEFLDYLMACLLLRNGSDPCS